MSLKSLVNASIIKSDLRRYWYLGALFAIMIFLTSVMFVTNGYHSSVEGFELLPFYDTRFADTMFISVFPICIFCVLINAIIFSYIQHKSAVSLMHSLPIRREKLYFSHIVSCAILVVVAFLVNVIILLSLREGAQCQYRVSDVINWFLVSLVYCFVISGLTVFCTAITGSLMASIVIPYAILLVPVFIEAIVYYLCDVYLYGFSADSAFVISSKIYLKYEGMFTKGGILLYLILGLLFLLGGLWAYKKRHLENNGTIVAFKRLNPVFLYAVAICAGFCGFMYIGEITDVESLWFAIPFGAVGVVIARMIIQKTFKPSKFIKPIVIYAVFVCVVYAFTGLDITGYEKRVPQFDEIESVNISGNYVNYGSTYINEVELYEDEEEKHDTTIKGEDIKKVIALHKAIIENQITTEPHTDYVSIPVEYQLKNNKTLKRNYYLRCDSEIYALYGEVMDIPVIKADRFSVLSDAKKHYRDARILVHSRAMKDVTNDDMLKLIEAIKADISTLKFKEYDNIGSAIQVRINYSTPTKKKNGEKVTDKSMWWERQETYNIRTSYKNTIALLNEWGIYNGLDIVGDIKSVTINKIADDMLNDVEMYKMTVSKSEHIELANISEKQKIEELIRYIDENIEANEGEGVQYMFNIEFNDGTYTDIYIKSAQAPPYV